MLNATSFSNRITGWNKRRNLWDLRIKTFQLSRWKVQRHEELVGYVFRGSDWCVLFSFSASFFFSTYFHHSRKFAYVCTIHWHFYMHIIVWNIHWILRPSWYNVCAGLSGHFKIYRLSIRKINTSKFVCHSCIRPDLVSFIFVVF